MTHASPTAEESWVLPRQRGHPWTPPDRRHGDEHLLINHQIPSVPQIGHFLVNFPPDLPRSPLVPTLRQEVSLASFEHMFET
jgi:hypothetical protein